MAIKRRSKIENAEVIIPARVRDDDWDDDDDDEDREERSESKVAVVEEELEPIFKGYANVIPIRGKDSSLDYYLMVLSKEVFA